MPRKGEDATEFQTYALARCVYACKDHIDFSGQYQYPIPPSHYLFNITQHLLVAGALLLLICHRGLQDPKLLDLTLQDVDRALGVLKLIGERFVGGTVGTEMLQNMKDNMKHSETWKTREAKIAAMEAANAAGTNQTQGPPFPPMPLPGPRRIPGILQPSNGIETAGAIQTSPPQRIPTGLQEDQSMSPSRNSGHGNNTRQHEQSQASIQSPIVYTGNTAALPASSVGGSGQMQTQTNMTMPAYNVYEPGYLYPKQPVQYADQAQMSQTPMLGYTGGASNSNFLDDYYQMTAPAYATGTPYGSSSAMPTYNTPDYQPLWPSDSLNFNIKDLEEITARSYNNSLMNNIGQPNNGQQYPFFQF